MIFLDYMMQNCIKHPPDKSFLGSRKIPKVFTKPSLPLQAEDLCHQEQFIDVTLSCGDHNFPAHKLILSVCSPYFRHLFLRNPCKHPIVVLKDVHFKYMKLLLMYMYRGEVSCPQEDLVHLLRTARSLQIRGLVELERKRELDGYLLNSLTGSPIKKVAVTIYIHH